METTSEVLEKPYQQSIRSLHTMNSSVVRTHITHYKRFYHGRNCGKRFINVILFAYLTLDSSFSVESTAFVNKFPALMDRLKRLRKHMPAIDGSGNTKFDN